MLRTLDLVHTEGGVLASRVLAYPVISDSMAVQSGIKLSIDAGTMPDADDED
ncbi:MAG: hypothetical protein ACKVRP_03375 [Bacteroidota bacterium]